MTEFQTYLIIGAAFTALRTFQPETTKEMKKAVTAMNNIDQGTFLIFCAIVTIGMILAWPVAVPRFLYRLSGGK